MSDVFQGPGWWLASDGLWYEPSSHPDESYRDAFAELAAKKEKEDAFYEVPTAWDFPSVEIQLPEESEASELDQPSVIRTASERSEVESAVTEHAATEVADIPETRATQAAEPVAVGVGGAGAGSGPSLPPDPSIQDAGNELDEGHEPHDEAEPDGHLAAPNLLESDREDLESDGEDREPEVDVEPPSARNPFAAPVVTPHLDTAEPILPEPTSAESSESEDDDDGWESGWSPIQTPVSEVGAAESAAPVVDDSVPPVDEPVARIDTLVAGTPPVSAPAHAEPDTETTDAPQFPQRRGRRSANAEQAAEAGASNSPAESNEDVETFGVVLPDIGSSEGPDLLGDAADDSTGTVEELDGSMVETVDASSISMVGAADADFVDNELIDLETLDDDTAAAPFSAGASAPSLDATGGTKGSSAKRSQSVAMEDARKERLAQAQKAAERMRDRARAERSGDDLAFVDEFESVAESQSVARGTRVPGAPGKVVGASSSDVIHAAPVVSSPKIAGRTKLEVQSNGSSPERSGSLGLAEPASTTTDLIHVPSVEKAPIDVMDRILSVLVFLSGLAIIAGTFMVWTTGPIDEVGWDRAEGIVSVVAGVVAATAAGPLFVGIRFLARPLAIIAGIVAVMVVGVVAVTTLTDAESTGLMLGAGLFTVLAGGLAAVVAAAAVRSDPFL